MFLMFKKITIIVPLSLLLVSSIFFALESGGLVHNIISEAATSVDVIPIKDPFFPYLVQRIYVFSTSYPGWWVGSNAQYFPYITLQSLDASVSAQKSFYIPFYASCTNGIEMELMGGTVPGSSYVYNTCTLKSSDDFHFLFPASPSGNLTSPVLATITSPSGSVVLKRTVYVTPSWW